MFKYLGSLAILGFSYFPSQVKVFLYRLMGAKIGKNVYFSLGSYVLPFGSSFRSVQIGSNCLFRDNVHISARNLIIGANTEIKEESRIWGTSDFSCGDGSYIDRCVLIDLRMDVTLGKGACVGAGASIYTHSAWNSAFEGYPVKFAPVKIGDRAWVAAKAFIMPGVTVGEGSVVGAMSVVLNDIPAGYLFAGNPAREIKKQVKRHLTLDQKNELAFDLLDKFTGAISADASLTKLSNDTAKISFSQSRRIFGFPLFSLSFVICYKKQIDRKYVDSFRGDKSKKTILLSLNFQGDAKKICDERGFYWIDLNNETCRINSHSIYNKISKIFGRYGPTLKNLTI